MNLDEGQKQRVRQWINDGLKLSEIQSRLDTELGLRLTYMETRLLLDDLRLQPKDAERVKVASPLTASAPVPPSQPDVSSGGAPPRVPTPETLEEPGDVNLTVDQITRPGAIVSGTVTFSDGAGADWYLDQLGRLGILPQQPGYKPSQADLMLFQGELQNELSKLGM